MFLLLNQTGAATASATTTTAKVTAEWLADDAFWL
jgi:hypothetical protein